MRIVSLTCHDRRMAARDRDARTGIDPGSGIVAISLDTGPERVLRRLDLRLAENIALDQIAVSRKKALSSAVR
jgi:hypothetical protein